MTENKIFDDSLLPLLLNGLRPVVAGKVVHIWGDDSQIYSRALSEARIIYPVDSYPLMPYELLLSPDPSRATEFAAGSDLLHALNSGLSAAICCLAPLPMLPVAMHVEHYICHQFAGVLLRNAQFAESQVTVLHKHDDFDRVELHLFILSAHPILPLRPGLYEGGWIPAPFLPPSKNEKLERKQNSRAVALAGRMLEMEDHILSLRTQIAKLKPQTMGAAASDGMISSFDMPKTRHPWPLVESSHQDSEHGLYDRRPDDSVLAEAHRGTVFLEEHGLLGSYPNINGAVAELNTMHRALLRGDSNPPDVSIIIPVYGQLGYTLNCIHSLLEHRSAFTAEIIIVDDCSPDLIIAESISRISGVNYTRQSENGGFISSCNAGADLAAGDYLVLLNNDTRVVPGWLDELIFSFSRFPRAGVVGSKMLYPDGSLQEAGGILWRDGSAWNYGRNDDPNRPQYCFARQVDYISGCSIAITASLWREMKGFDRYYAPAYAEDADLCQRVRVFGLEIWFQPYSRVIHYEGKTSGTSTKAGIKAYQEINVRKLFLRWRKQLEKYRRRAEGTFFEKERDVSKRILFVDAVTPTPDQDAGSVQTLLAMRCAQLAGYKVHFAPEDNWLYDPKYTAALQREGIECSYAPFDIGFESFIRLYGWLFDVVVVYRVNIMYKCLSLLRAHAAGAALLFHLADLHYLRLQRQAEIEGDQELSAYAQDLKLRELTLISQSDCTITHSTVEATLIDSEVEDASVMVWPLMMTAAGTKVPYASRRDICFLGGYRHPPNVDAVFWFVREVFPLIRSKRPDIRFIVAGANPTQEILALASDCVVVTGLVEDLSDVLDTARVFVCPLRIGAGAKGKVMSALAHGLPIVSTPIGVEGAGLVENEHVLVAERPAALAEAVIRLDSDPALWMKLSKAGLRLIQEQFSIDMGVSKLESAIEIGHRNRLGLLDRKVT